MTGRVHKAGFTLIELSIVLVIIGLIVGGVLVGQSLVSAAGVRAQITQIEKFNTAANTFFSKYGYLPGDIPDPAASSFGFLPRGSSEGQGDGNGFLEGNCSTSGPSHSSSEGGGETLMFWVDLSSVHLINDSFTAATSSMNAPVATLTSSPSVASFFPLAKLGSANFIYVFSGDSTANHGNTVTGVNYFGLSAVTGINCQIASAAGLTVRQGYEIDSKIDDGLPQSGNVLATYLSGSSPVWAAGAGGTGPNGTSATQGTSATCYDNGNNPGAKQQYSVEISDGANVNCALSFKMQAGD